MEIEQRIARGARAQEVLDNEIYQESFEIVKERITEAWQKAPMRDLEGMLRLRQMLEAVELTKQALVTTMETGKMAQLDLKHQETIVQKAKRSIQDW